MISKTAISQRAMAMRKAGVDWPTNELEKVALQELTIEARQAASAKPASGARPAATVTAGARFTQADVDKATGAARAQERQRISTVFASDHSRGRERLCASILSAPDGWPASDIVARLPNMGTDATLERKASEADRARSDAVWGRANGKVEARTVPTPRAAKDASVANDPWAKAYSRAAGASA